MEGTKLGVVKSEKIVIDKSSDSMKMLVEMIRFDQEGALLVLHECGNPFPIHFTDKEGNSPFHAAARVGSIEIFEYLVSTYSGEDSPYTKKNTEGETPLLLAVLNNHLPLVSFLLSNGSSINEKTKSRLDRSLLASHNGNYYFSHGICVKETTKQGMNSLQAAASKGNLKILQFFFNNNFFPSPTTIDDYDNANMTCLHFAAAGGHTKTVRWLFYNGSKISERDKFSMSSLLHAAKGGHLDTVRWLVDHGCDIEEIDMRPCGSGSGRSSLLYAARGGHFVLFQWLFDHGCSLEKRDIDGKNALLLAAEGGHTEMVQWMYERGCSLEVEAHLNITVLMLAAERGHTQTVRWLVDHGCNVDKRDADEGMTCLHFAAQGGHTETVQWLIEYGCNMEEIDGLGMTAFHNAAESNHITTIRWLLERGYSMNMEEAEAISTHISEYKGENAFGILEILVNYGGITLENLKPILTEKYFSAFVTEIKMKYNKRAAH